MFKPFNSRGFTVAEVATLLGMTALLGSFLVPSLASVGNTDVNNSTITVSESSVVVAEPETLPVEEILVNITNTTTGETLSRTVAPGTSTATFTGLDPQANYTVEVAKKSQAGMSAKATAKVDYIKVAEETKQGTRPVDVDDTTKPIMVDDTARPIMGQVDRGSYQQRTVWVDTSYWQGGYDQVPNYGDYYSNCTYYYWGSCPTSYWDTCASYSCQSVYVKYHCSNSKCTSGWPVYETQCGCNGGWVSSSYSCQLAADCGSWQYGIVSYSSVWNPQQTRINQGYNTQETYWAPNMVTEVVGYEKKVAGYQKKTITETFNYQVDVRQAVTTAKEVKAPARQLVIEVSGTPRRSFNWATGTVTAVGNGVSGFAKGDTVYFRMGTVFTFDGKQYLRVPAQSFLVRK